MAVCEDCEQEMLVADSCSVDVLIIQGERFERGQFTKSLGDRCGDCGVREGGLHHLGCDLESCPRCRRQLISCGCAWTGEDEESLVGVANGVVVYPAALRGLPVSDPRHPLSE